MNIDDELDKLKDKLRLDTIDDDDKKELFNKFVESGGRPGDPRIQKQREFEKAKDNYIKQKSKHNLRQSSNKDKTKKIKTQSSKQKKYEDSNFFIFDKINLLIRGFFGRVTTIAGHFFKNNFLSMVKNDAQTALLDINEAIKTILSSGNKNELLYLLFNASPTYYELILRLDTLYDYDKWDYFIKFSKRTFGNMTQSAHLDDFLTSLLKRIYIFYGYSQRCIDSILFALETMVKNGYLTEAELTRYKKSIKENIYFLFDKFLPKLLIAVCFVVKENLRLEDNKKIREILGFSEDDEIGYLVELKQKEIRTYLKKKTEDDKTQSEEDDETKQEKEELPETAKWGKETIEAINFTIDEKDTYNYKFEPNDKLLYVQRIIDFFDKHFAFIFSSNKIKFNIDYQTGKKVDINDELTVGYTNLMDIYFNSLKEYSNVLEEYTDVKEKPMLNPVQKTVKLEHLYADLNRISFKFREDITNVINKLIITLKKVLEDPSQHINNPNELLTFQSIEGKQLMEDKTAFETLGFATSYLLYFRHLLVNGKLASSFVHIDDTDSK